MPFLSAEKAIAVGFETRAFLCDIGARMEVQGLNEANVRRLVRYWQKRLGLSHWAIKVELVEAGHGKDRVCGENDWDQTNLRAKIRITTAHDSLIELVDTVIHELLHLHFWFIKEEGLKMDLLEMAFHRICRPMAELYMAQAKPCK